SQALQFTLLFSLPLRFAVRIPLASLGPRPVLVRLVRSFSPAVGRAGRAQAFWVGAERPVVGLLDGLQILLNSAPYGQHRQPRHPASGENHGIWEGFWQTIPNGFAGCDPAPI